MRQLNLFELPPIADKWQIENFSAGDFSRQSARKELERRLIGTLVVSNDISRQSVSYQLSKKDNLHRWLKYREGFSADLVERLLKEFNIKAGDTILDPFVGSGTTSIVAKMQGVNSIGFDILPISGIAIKAKESVFDYDLQEMEQLISDIEELTVPENYTKLTNHITITDGAYPESTEREIAFFTEWNAGSRHSRIAKNLVTLSILNSLERVSYTSKDGQFLRWNYDKIPPALKLLLLEELRSVYDDICAIQKSPRPADSTLQFIAGSALYELPKLQSEILDGVITSPPYCNRYDYTRTYALELAYLGVTDERIRCLRQELLSCTVENKPKIDYIKGYYKQDDFDRIMTIVQTNDALAEVRNSLSDRNKNGDINNRGILRMVDSYFTELSFIYAELFRLCKSGAKVAFVNDNVRYGGEVIPVDFISTELAEQIGFRSVKVYSLKQQKGNSSQQMAKFGRIALRKSITVWEKP